MGKEGTPPQPLQKELAQQHTLSHLDEVLFDLDGPGQGLHIRGLHLQFFLLRGHNRLESSELPLGTEEEAVKNFRKPEPKASCCPISHWGHPHGGGGQNLHGRPPKGLHRQGKPTQA